MAVKMEISMLQKCGGDPESARVQSSPDLQVRGAEEPFSSDAASRRPFPPFALPPWTQTVDDTDRCAAQVIVTQVPEDQKLLSHRIMKLSGKDGVARLGEALSSVRRQYEEHRRLVDEQGDDADGEPLSTQTGEACY